MIKEILNEYDFVRPSVKCYRCDVICSIKWYLNICRICAEKEYKIIKQNVK